MSADDPGIRVISILDEETVPILDGTRDTHDVVLAEDGEVCHTFTRDPDEPAKLAAQGLDDDEWRELVGRLAVPRDEE